MKTFLLLLLLSVMVGLGDSGFNRRAIADTATTTGEDLVEINQLPGRSGEISFLFFVFPFCLSYWWFSFVAQNAQVMMMKWASFTARLWTCMGGGFASTNC